MSNLYNIITELCQKKGVYPGKMCSDLGMSRSFMTNLKSGWSNGVTLRTAKKLSEYFNVPVETFLGSDNDDSEEITPVEQIQDELFEKRKLLFDLSGKAKEEDLDKFIKMLNVMLGEDEN